MTTIRKEEEEIEAEKAKTPKMRLNIEKISLGLK